MLKNKGKNKMSENYYSLTDGGVSKNPRTSKKRALSLSRNTTYFQNLKLILWCKQFLPGPKEWKEMAKNRKVVESLKTPIQQRTIKELKEQKNCLRLKLSSFPNISFPKTRESYKKIEAELTRRGEKI